MKQGFNFKICWHFTGPQSLQELQRIQYWNWTFGAWHYLVHEINQHDKVLPSCSINSHLSYLVGNQSFTWSNFLLVTISYFLVTNGQDLLQRNPAPRRWGNENRHAVHLLLSTSLAFQRCCHQLFNRMIEVSISQASSKAKRSLSPPFSYMGINWELQASESQQEQGTLLGRCWLLLWLPI